MFLPSGKTAAEIDRKAREEAQITMRPVTGRVSRAKKGACVYTCEICRPPKTFTREEHLRRHQLSHQTPPHPCTYPGCERAFHRADLLARHTTRQGRPSIVKERGRRCEQKISTFFGRHIPCQQFSIHPHYMWNDVPSEYGPVPDYSSIPAYSGTSLAYDDSTSFSFEQSSGGPLSASYAPSTYPNQQYSTSETVPQTTQQDDFLWSAPQYNEIPQPIRLDNVHESTTDTAAESSQALPFAVYPNSYGIPEAYQSGTPHDVPYPWHEEAVGHSFQEPESSTRTVYPLLDANLHHTARVVDSFKLSVLADVSEDVAQRHGSIAPQLGHLSGVNTTVSEEKRFADTTYQPLDADEAPTDSGYGSVQARQNLITSIREASPDAQVEGVPDSVETRTLYSEASTLRGPQLDFYVSEFAEELAAVLPRSLSKELLATFKNVLPHLLEAFAIKIGHGYSDQLCRRLMYVVYKYREQISKAVIGVFAYEEEEDDTVKDTPHIKDMSIADKMCLWQKQEDLPEEHGHDQMPWGDENDDNDEIEDYPELQEYRETLTRSRAFAWLESAMLRELNMEIPGGSSAQSEVRHEILVALNKQVRVSRREPPKTHALLFELPWLAKFISEQEYDLAAHEAFPRALVLVGVEDHAWATTCLDYARTVWPQSGESIVVFIAHLLRQELGTSISCTLDDNMNLTAKVDTIGKVLEVIAVGSSYALAEIGEIFAWLQAAFRTSPEDGFLFSVAPVCQVSESQWDVPAGTDIPNPPKRCRLFWKGAVHPAKSSHNCCWSSFFRNPALVKGYPIPRHAEVQRGMEMDLGTITELMGTRKISRFTGKLLLKTVLAALVPLHQKDGFVYWHLVASMHGDYLSYCDERLQPLLDKAATGLSPAILERSRHIVGWSANVQNVTGCEGGPQACYDIGWSGLKQPSPGCVLDKITITGGSYITAGISCVLGKRDKAVHTRARDDYTMRLKWIAKKFVVLYDVQDRRAWLVDGTSALLHLVRASLKHDASDPFRSLLLYTPDMLQEAPSGQSGKLASIDVLTNSHNVSIPLFSKPPTSRKETIAGPADAEKHVTTQTQTYYCFRDRVQGISDVLEQIMAHQADESTKDGIGFRFKSSARRQLEGFDFMDVAMDEDPFWPRMTTLRATGRGWADFTRAIHAITLFGTGFGELIRPVLPDQGSIKSCGECQLNTAVPKGQDTLAVCVSELQEILQKRGSTNTSPWRLVDDIYWHAPDKTFEACQCRKNSSMKHERMQVLLSSSMPNFWTRGLRSPINMSLALVSQGAVVFGHSRRFPLRWRDHGLPEEGTPDMEVEELENSIRDSGLGSSIDSTSVNDTSQDGSPSRCPLPLPDQNEACKRHHELAFAPVSAEGPVEKRRKLWENGPMSEAGGKSRALGHGLSPEDSNNRSSRFSNVFESVTRWNHASRNK